LLSGTIGEYSMQRVLIIGQNSDTARAIGPAVEQGDAFRAGCAVGIAEAVAHGTLDAAQYAAILVTDATALENPETACGRLRQIWPQCPIIFLATAASEADIVRGLNAGACDYMVAPWRSGELRARLRAQIRAHANSEGRTFQIGPYRFLPQQRLLQHVTRNVAIRLTHKETEMLKFLHRAEGRPVARQILLRDLWGYREGADSYTIESHIYRLRRKLETDPSRPRFLLNEAGGYVLITAPPRPWPPARSERPLQLAG
jgi:DNA-binding response OmpR family regulator